MYNNTLQEIENKLQDACSLGLEGLLYIAPYQIHLIYLHDRWTQFRIKQLSNGRIHKIVTLKDFITTFLQVEDHDKNLLCELYLFNFVIPDHTRWNPNPFVGDVQLRDFTSFIYGWVQWWAAHDSYTQVEFNSSLIVREEYPIPSVIIEDYKDLLQDPTNSQRVRVHR
jgi:hypothetical protein